MPNIPSLTEAETSVAGTVISYIMFNVLDARLTICALLYVVFLDESVHLLQTHVQKQ